MDKLSEYIPILIILVSVIFSIVGKKKKLDNVRQETTLPGKTPGEFIDENRVPRTVDSYPKVIEAKPPKPMFQKQEIKKDRDVASFSPPASRIDVVETESPSFSFEEEDVMRAIIYSEIINKKEW